MKYDYMAQTQEIKELLEFVAQQQLTTQLIAVIILLLIVFAIVGVFILRGGFKVFDNLSKSINNLADVDKEAQKTQEDLVSAVNRFSKQNEARYEKVDEIWHQVMGKVTDIDERFNSFYVILEKNPLEHQTVINLLTEINNKLDDAKQKTDELEAIPS